MIAPIRLFLAVFGCLVAAAEQTPAPYRMFPSLTPNDTEAARRVWRPSDCAGQVSVGREGKVRYVRFPCLFSKKPGYRAYWDANATMDLRTARGIRFWFRCRDASPVAYFNLFLKSGDGWYSATFAPRADGRWEEITILKTDTRAEGAPAGWGRIQGVRISPWLGKKADTYFDVTAIGAVDADMDVLIVRDTSGKGRGGARYTANVAAAFAAFGIYPAMVATEDLNERLLRPGRLVVLPYDPGLPANVVHRLRDFVARGGFILGFYSAPPGLLEILGMRLGKYHSGKEVSGGFSEIRFVVRDIPGLPAAVHQNSWNITEVLAVPGKSRVAARWFDGTGRDTGRNAVVFSDHGAWVTHVYLHQDYENGPRMVMALAARFVPSLWPLAAQRRMQKVGKFGPFSGYADATARLAPAAHSRQDAAAALRRARQWWERARSLLKGRRYAEAIAAGEAADAALKEAYYRTRRSRPGEFRGVWCHRPYGIKGWTWDESIRRLKQAGFNAIFPNMCWGGLAYYPSTVLPVARMVREKGDQLAACLAACRKYGVQVHVWRVDWNLSHCDPAFYERLKKEGRLFERRPGHPGKWLCPSNPLNQRLEIDAMVEIVRRYPVDGIHFDYIRYPGGEGCFCEGCRKRFEEYAHVHVRNWPDDVRKDGPLAQQWLAFRRKNITDVVRGVHREAKRIRPDIRISAAVFRNWPSARDAVAQDWVAWCREGLLDFVCPMDYIPRDREFERTVRLQLEWLRPTRTPLYPGIGLSTARFGAADLIEQIEICRRLGTPGFLVFEYNSRPAEAVFPHLAKGLTAR